MNDSDDKGHQDSGLVKGENKTVFQPPRDSVVSSDKPSLKAAQSKPLLAQHKKQEKTVFQARAKASGQSSDTGDLPAQSASNAALDRKAPRDSTHAEEYKDALTRIGNAIRAQDNSQGFVKARKAADQALAENKIILNKRFVLEATLGAGGMGTVYRARDLRKVEASEANPCVAVKVLNDDFKDHPSAFITLQREASRSHILSHPNIVTVHDFDRDGDIIYMTMELLNGVGLEALINQHRPHGLALPEALSIINDFCLALIFAHKKNIVHSDLKPGNIFITDDGAKVLDFGIARITNQAASDDVFDAGTLGALTPSYASLEMLRGDDPHPADDIYAAAIIAYELFSGQHPYARKSAEQALEENLKPPRIESLSKRQWRALDTALKLKRRERTQDLSVLLDGLVNIPKFPVFKVTTAILVLLLGSVGYYYKFVASDNLSSLAASTLQKGVICFEQGDFVCAVDSAKATLNIEPDHPQANQLLVNAELAWQQKEMENLFGELSSCISEKADLDCANSKLNQLEQADTEHTLTQQARAQVNQFKQTVALDDALAIAQRCLTEENYDCVLSSSEQALTIDPNNIRAQELIAQANADIALQAENAKRIELELNKAVAASEACLQRNDFTCAAARARYAVELDSANQTAQTALQKVMLAESNYRESFAKAENILNKGKKCLVQKNYSCAIASADSALEFVENYPAALALKNTAQQEINKLKMQIQIQ